MKPQEQDAGPRELPRNNEAEMCLLGSVMLLTDCLDDVALLIDAQDFFNPAHVKLYGHLLAIRDTGRLFDMTLFTDRLKAAGDFEEIGGAAYLSKLLNCVPNAAHAVYYAELVRDTSMRRRMILAGTRIASDGYEPMDLAEYVAGAESEVFAAANRCQKLAGAADLNQSVLAALGGLDRRSSGQALRGVSSGLYGLDSVTGGFQPGEVNILAGRTSMGKTALALNIAAEVATEQPVLLFSLEMDSLSIAERLLSTTAGVRLGRMRDGTIGRDERMRLSEAADQCGQLKIRMDDTSGRTVSQLGSICRREHRRSALGLVIIDYLQLLEPDNHREPRHEQVSKISRRLKGLARELKVPLLVLAQLNRQATVTKDNRPALSHLRESGAIEQDADVVIFCHRPAYYTNERSGPEGEKAELIVAKNRQGPTASIEVLWFGASMSFRNKAEDRFAPVNNPKRVQAFDEYNAASEAAETF
jgi:replicative DNA helicase